MAPLKRRRTGGGHDGCAHFASAAAVYAQQLRAKAVSNSKSATRDQRDVEHYSSATVSECDESHLLYSDWYYDRSQKCPCAAFIRSPAASVGMSTTASRALSQASASA